MHFRFELCFALRPRAFLYLDEATHLGTNRIHQLLALTTAYKRQCGSPVMVAVQLYDMRQFRHFGIYQWSHCVQVFLGSTD